MVENKHYSIDELLALPPYSFEPKEKAHLCFEIIRDWIINNAGLLAEYKNYVRSWPIAVEKAQSIEELPFIPVSVFKRNPPLAVVPESQFQRVLLSSSTTGQEPSRIAVDSLTSKRMTKGAVAIFRDFIGDERRPYCVIDTADINSASAELAARGAAIRGLSPFASKTTYCCVIDKSGEPVLDKDIILKFSREHSSQKTLVYGFTTMLWTKMVAKFYAEGISLSMPHAYVLHSGGWKKLTDQAVTKEEFIEKTASVFGCPRENVIDFYGMVENLGIVYPDCSQGNKHAPVFGEVIIRNPLSMKRAEVNQTGLVQVCSLLPTSFPGHLLLTEDLGRVIAYDGCACQRRGIAFRFEGRVPRAEIRGCGNIGTSKFQRIESSNEPRENNNRG